MQYASGLRPLIMIVEDHERIIEVVIAYLEQSGFEARAVRTTAEALVRLPQWKPDLIILDISLGDQRERNGSDELDEEPTPPSWRHGEEGLGLCQQIRAGGGDGTLAQFADIPILILTGYDDQHHILSGFDVGADDYLVKPFTEGELVRRVRALLRRSKGESNALVEVHPLRIDPSRKTVWAAGKEILGLSPKEFDLLYILACARERVISREELQERVWGYSYQPGDRTVDVHIGHLRRKLAGVHSSCYDMVKTERGIGYRLVALQAHSLLM